MPTKKELLIAIGTGAVVWTVLMILTDGGGWL